MPGIEPPCFHTLAHPTPFQATKNGNLESLSKGGLVCPLPIFFNNKTKRGKNTRNNKIKIRVENLVASRAQGCGQSAATSADEQRLQNQSEFPNSCICFFSGLLGERPQEYSPLHPPPPSHPPLPPMSRCSEERENQAVAGLVGHHQCHECDSLSPALMASGRRVPTMPPCPIWADISTFGRW